MTMLRRAANHESDRPASTRHRHRRRMRGLSLAFLAVLVTASVLSAWTVRRVVRHQEESLLKERASEVSLVLGSSISTVQSRLALLATVARMSSGSPQSFADAATTGDRGLIGSALLRDTPDGFVVELAAGPAFTVGQTMTGPRADAMRRATQVPAIVGTPVLSGPSGQTLGFAL